LNFEFNPQKQTDVCTHTFEVGIKNQRLFAFHCFINVCPFSAKSKSEFAMKIIRKIPFYYMFENQFNVYFLSYVNRAQALLKIVILLAVLVVFVGVFDLKQAAVRSDGCCNGCQYPKSNNIKKCHHQAFL
jgi:hypothetical protein